MCNSFEFHNRFSFAIYCDLIKDSTKHGTDICTDASVLESIHKIQWQTEISKH